MCRAAVAARDVARPPQQAFLVRIAANRTAIAIDLALGLAHLPVVQSFQHVRDEPIASLRRVAESRDDDVGAGLLREVVKVPS